MSNPSDRIQADLIVILTFSQELRKNWSGPSRRKTVPSNGVLGVGMEALEHTVFDVYSLRVRIIEEIVVEVWKVPR
jgi:hypothetical protein